jgi:rfaE bifunctional protein nucleotidyltransferase chain/domain
MGQVMTQDEALRIRAEWQTAGQRVVMTNGVFDLLHVGHARYLAQARALGDRLIVGLNSDASVRLLKGPERPILPLAERAELLAMLRVVDLVVPFEERTAHALLDLLRPEIYVKGGDYTLDKPPPEAALVEGYGGEVRLLFYIPGRSTSDIIRAIRTHTSLA